MLVVVIVHIVLLFVAIVNVVLLIVAVVHDIVFMWLLSKSLCLCGYCSSHSVYAVVFKSLCLWGCCLSHCVNGSCCPRQDINCSCCPSHWVNCSCCPSHCVNYSCCQSHFVNGSCCSSHFVIIAVVQVILLMLVVPQVIVIMRLLSIALRFIFRRLILSSLLSVFSFIVWFNWFIIAIFWCLCCLVYTPFFDIPSSGPSRLGFVFSFELKEFSLIKNTFQCGSPSEIGMYQLDRFNLFLSFARDDFFCGCCSFCS